MRGPAAASLLCVVALVALLVVPTANAQTTVPPTPFQSTLTSGNSVIVLYVLAAIQIVRHLVGDRGRT